MKPERPEKKPERPEKKPSRPHSPPSPSSCPSFSSLPDEITASYLARIPRPYYPRLSILSKCFRSLISSPQLSEARAKLGTTEQCLYVSLRESTCEFPKWFTLLIRPDDMRKKKKENTTGQVLVPIPSSKLASSSKSMVSVGSEIYVIGGPIDGAPAPAVRILDCRTHTWRNGPRMIVSRKDAAACVHDGKIYVLGGCKEWNKDESWAEVFDPKTQIWECLPDPGTEISKITVERIEEIEGKLIFRGEKTGTYAYHPKGYKWERCEFIGAFSELVIGNVTYVFHCPLDRFALWWSSVKCTSWREVKGVDSVIHKFTSSGGRYHKLVGCGNKLYLIWEVVKGDNKEIWCAEILLEMRRGSDGPFWGQVEERSEVLGEVKWIHLVLTVPISCQLFQCLAVTV